MRSAAPPRTQQITSIVLMVALLVMIVVMRKQCAQGTANLFNVVATVSDGGEPASPPPAAAPIR